MRRIAEIEAEIRQDWKNVNYAAVPYLNAMMVLGDINSSYGLDSAREIVSRFLCNASTWRGENARRIKKELKDMLK